MFEELSHFELLLFRQEVDMRRRGLFPALLNRFANEGASRILVNKSVVFEEQQPDSGQSRPDSGEVIIGRTSVVDSAVEQQSQWIDICVPAEASEVSRRPQKGRQGTTVSSGIPLVLRFHSSIAISLGFWIGWFVAKGSQSSTDTFFPSTVAKVCLKPLEANLLLMRDKASQIAKKQPIKF